MSQNIKHGVSLKESQIGKQRFDFHEYKTARHGFALKENQKRWT